MEADDKTVIYSKEFYEKVQKMLSIGDNPTIQRAGKFIKRGYTISKYEKIALFNNAVNSGRTPEEEKQYSENV